MIASSKAFELAIELVNYVADPGRPRAASAETTLESVCIDQLGRIDLALEVEIRFGHAIPDGEVHTWRTIADVARSLTPVFQRTGAAT